MYFSWLSGMLSFLILFALEHKAVVGKGFFLTLKVNLWCAPCLSCPLACPAEENSRSAALNGSREAKVGFSSCIKGIFYTLTGTD